MDEPTTLTGEALVLRAEVAVTVDAEGPPAPFNDVPVPATSAPPAPRDQPVLRIGYGMSKVLAAALAVLTMGLAACAESDTGGSSGATSASEPAAKKKNCTNRATADCTPRVRMGKSVRVDALYWSVTNVRTASTLGDQDYGLGAKADGTFVIVNVKVRSDKDESATLTDEAIQIETVDGNKYKADNDGTVAAIGGGDDPLWFDDIGPDATLKSKVVFDLPDSALRKRLSVRFNELGLGSTHGYIRLPSLKT